MLSVTCSHFTASLRASRAGTKTPLTELQNTNGCVNEQALCDEDPALKQMVPEGYRWTILQFYTKILFPELPGVAQEALNAEHSA